MSVWTLERVDRLKQLWADGLSASDIARSMGCFSHCDDGGRHAVIGKVHRLGLANRVTATRPKIHGTPRAKRKYTKPRNKPFSYAKRESMASTIIRDGMPIPDPKETDIPRIAFVDLEAKHCRFVATKEPAGPYEPQFCGADRVPGTSYCEDHVRRCFSVPPPRRPAPAVPAPAEQKVLQAA